MARKVTKTYSIGSAKDEMLCGTCARLLRGGWVECALFGRDLKTNAKEQAIRCPACLKAEVK